MITLDISPIPSGRRARALASRSVFVSDQRSWVPATELAAELGVSRRTLTRWVCNIALGLPQPHCVNHRLYFERGAVEQWKAATAVKAAWGALISHAPENRNPAKGGRVRASMFAWRRTRDWFLYTATKQFMPGLR